MLCNLWNEYIFRLDVNLCDKFFVKSAVAALTVSRSRIVLVCAVDFYILAMVCCCRIRV